MADENAPSQRTVLGRSKIFTPEVIDDIHMKSELGRYRMRGFSMFKKIPHWDELIFLPGTLTRFVIEGYREKCDTKAVLGGHLMGQKVTEQVAEMRSLPAGIDQRSPARHPDWLGPDDLSLKVQETREATNYEIPIQLKLGAARVYDDVRMAAKCG